MGMREKLYRLIHNFVFEGPDVSDMNLADHLIANGVTVQRWIPVAERLPGEDDLSALGEVLVMREGDVCDAVYLPSRSVFYRHGYRQDDVPHWMPIPKPLKEAD